MPLTLPAKMDKESDSMKDSDDNKTKNKRGAPSSGEGASVDTKKDEQKEKEKERKAEAKRAAGELRSANKKILVLLTKQILRSAQTDRALWGAIVDTGITKAETPMVLNMQEQGSNYNEAVRSEGAGHQRGPPFIWAFGGMLVGLLKMKDEMQAEVFDRLKLFADTYSDYTVKQKCELVRMCRVDRTFDSKTKRITMMLALPEARQVVIEAWDEVKITRKFGAAPATFLEREIQLWLEALMSS